MSAGGASGGSGSYRTLADRFTERYEADDSWWSRVEERWREDDEENRILLAPVSRTVVYGDMEGSDHLTVTWKDDSAVMVTFLGTEDENWDFIDDHAPARLLCPQEDRLSHAQSEKSTLAKDLALQPGRPLNLA